MTLTFDHYAIFVDDLVRSVEFYRKVLGFEEIPDPFRDGRHAWFRIGGNQQLHIITPRESGPRPTADAGVPGELVRRGGDVHFAFHVESLSQFIAHLESLGIPFGDQQSDGKIRMRPDGIPQIYLEDPDGHWLEVTEAKY